MCYKQTKMFVICYHGLHSIIDCIAYYQAKMDLSERAIGGVSLIVFRVQVVMPPGGQSNNLISSRYSHGMVYSRCIGRR